MLKVRELWDQVKPLYVKLHKYVALRLKGVEAVGKPLPVHLLSMFYFLYKNLSYLYNYLYKEKKYVCVSYLFIILYLRITYWRRLVKCHRVCITKKGRYLSESTCQSTVKGTLSLNI